MNEREWVTQKEDAGIEEALRNFRTSVRNWSEEEFARPRPVPVSRRSGFWLRMANPVLGWTLASAMLVAAVGVPSGLHYRHQVEAERQAAVEARQRQAAEEARKAEAQAAASLTDDEDFLNHVDSDIAQATPDALQPLASLMSDSSSR